MQGNVGHPGERENQGWDPNVIVARARDTLQKNALVKAEVNIKKRAKAKAKIRTKPHGEEKAKERVRMEKARECILWMIGGDQEQQNGAHN